MPRRAAPSQNFFSMEEVVLALVLVVMGLIAAMQVLPVGLQANRDSVGRITASNAADFFLHFMSNEIQSDRMSSEVFPDHKPMVLDGYDWTWEPLDVESNLIISFAAMMTLSWA